MWVEAQLRQQSGVSAAATVVIPPHTAGSHCGCQNPAPRALDYSSVPGNSKQMSQNAAPTIFPRRVETCPPDPRRKPDTDESRW